MKKTGKILILDGKSRSALAATQSLGQKGIWVEAGNDSKNCPTLYSKYVRVRHIYPEPEEYPNEFVNWLIDTLKKTKFDTIIPSRDVPAELISENKIKLSRYTNVLAPNFNSFAIARDKSLIAKQAEKLGIPHPKSYFFDRQTLSQIKKEIKYPILVRPCSNSGSRGMYLATSSRDLDRKIKKSRAEFPDIFLQEFVPHKRHFSTVILFDRRHNLVASFAQEKLHQYPLTGGPATLVESVRRDDVIENSIKILKSIDWVGPAHFDYVVDERDGLPKVLEINPRLWNTLYVSLGAGVDFPYLQYRLALREKPNPVTRYKLGYQYRMLPQDYLWYFNSPNKIKNIPQLFGYTGKKVSYDIPKLTDISPAYGLIKETINIATTKEGRKKAFGRGW